MTGEHPQTFYLHGNVRAGYCADHRKSQFDRPTMSHAWATLHRYSPDLPRHHENYAADPYTSAQWNNLKHALKNAYLFTIFGYSAPNVGHHATRGGTPATRNLEEIEIIDVKSEEELRTTWEPFIHTHHYRTHKSWYRSWIAEYPRRTCEAMWSTLMQNDPHSPAGAPSNADFPELWTWLEPLLMAEHQPT